MIANGSDGDRREMKFMLEHTGLGRKISSFPKNSEEYLFLRLCPGLSCNIRTLPYKMFPIV
jgi:hypothetical protein